MHGVLNRLFDNRLIFPPVRSPRRILDLGCGAGDWAADVAEQNPNAEVCFTSQLPVVKEGKVWRHRTLSLLRRTQLLARAAKNPSFPQ